ncbi:UPF0481 protein At3g47200-like [Oryza glaberrima]|uniref:UPF0481 protein At3g47200-like n=1 Tax=Oryza glaberrima TaxID=4538 RepID=UPI00224C2429|nr:UPF0481 protein At3g47200-like [Oryza glaberrima]
MALTVEGSCNSHSHVVVVIDGNNTTAAAPTNQSASHRRDPEVCPLISKVHGRVRSIDPGAYDPMVVSLGPYHAGRDDLLQMQREKPMCMREICSLTGRTELYYLQQVISAHLRRQALAYYLHGIHDLKQAAAAGRNERDNIILLNFRFNRMLLHDAAFLLVTMKALDNVAAAAHGERRTHGRWTDVAIVHDLLLLENQIPFAVVEKLYYEVAAVGEDDDGHCKPFSDVMRDFVRSIIEKHANRGCSIHQNGRAVHHLLHQCHMLLEPTKSPATGDTTGSRDDDDDDDASVDELKRRWHRAVQYHVAGVGLTKRIFDGGVRHHRLLDVEYRGGALEIPVLHVYDNTCSMLRNLMAMEQATAGVGNYVTAYCVFLSRLMCTAEDVALLTKKGILVHHLGSDEVVAGLFADLCKNVVFDDDDVGCNYLREACVAADERYQSRVRNWITWLKHKHFGNPWLATAAIAAVVVTICTVVQAVCAVLPKKQ